MSAEQLHYELESLQEETRQALLQFRRQKNDQAMQQNLEQLLKRMKVKYKQLQSACKSQPDNRAWAQWREDHKKEYTSLRAMFDKLAPQAIQQPSNTNDLSSNNDSFSEKPSKKRTTTPAENKNNNAQQGNTGTNTSFSEKSVPSVVIVNKQANAANTTATTAQQNNDDDDEVKVVKKQKTVTADDELNSRLEQELFAPVFQTYDKTLQLLDKMNRDAEDTIQVAQETANLLAQQEEKMKHIDSQLDELSNTTTRAKREIVSLARKLAADKCILIICILCVLVIAAFALFTIGAFVLRPVIENALKKKEEKQ